MKLLFAQSWSNWKWYLLKIEGECRKNLVKVWDKRWWKLLKVMKWFAILTFFKLCMVMFAVKKLETFLILVEKYLNMVMFIVGKIFLTIAYFGRKLFEYAYVSTKFFFDLPLASALSITFEHFFFRHGDGTGWCSEWQWQVCYWNGQIVSVCHWLGETRVGFKPVQRLHIETPEGTELMTCILYFT